MLSLALAFKFILVFIGFILYSCPFVVVVAAAFYELIINKKGLYLYSYMKFWFLGFAAPLYLSQKVILLLSILIYIGFWQIFFSLGSLGSLPTECVLPKEFNDSHAKNSSLVMNSSMISISTLIQREERPIDLSEFISFKEHFSDKPFEVPSSDFDILTIRGCLNTNKNLKSSREMESLLDLLNTMDTAKTAKGMRLYKAEIEKFGIIFQRHYSDNLDTMIDVSASDSKKMEALQNILRFIPFYLEFQIKSIDPFLDLIQYKTRTHDYTFNSIVDHVVSSTSTGKQVRGIVHLQPTSLYDPYAAITVDNCVQFFESRVKPFLLAEVLEHKKNRIIESSTMLSGQPLDVWTGEISSVSVPLTPSPFQSTTSSAFVEEVVDVSSAVEVSSQTTIVPQPSIELDGDFMVNFGLQIEPALAVNLQDAVDAVQRPSETTIVEEQPSIDSAVEGMVNSGHQIEPARAVEAVDPEVIVNEQLPSQMRIVEEQPLDVAGVVNFLQQMESALTDNLQDVIAEVNAHRPAVAAPLIESAVSPLSPLPPVRSFEGIEQPPIQSAVNIKDAGKLKYQWLTLRNHNMEIQVDLKHKYMALGFVNMGIIGIGVYIFT